MDKNFTKSFSTCPCCGSSKRFFQELTEYAKSRKHITGGHSLHLHDITGTAVDKESSAHLLIGSTVPAFKAQTDICMDCGNVYATELRMVEMQTRAVQGKQQTFNPSSNLRAN